MSATLTSIFLSNRKSIMWSVMRIVRDPQVAEDVAQETYMRASKVAETGTIDHVEAFLFQTARNLAINHKRRQDMRGRVERDDISETDLPTSLRQVRPRRLTSSIGSACSVSGKPWRGCRSGRVLSGS